MLQLTTAIATSADPGTVWWGLPLALAAVAVGAWAAGAGRPVRRGVVRR